MTSPSPLAGRAILEHVRAGASPVTQRAIAIAGRIAVDLGAHVVRLLDPGLCEAEKAAARAASQWSRTRAGAPPISIFLDGGKAVAELPAAGLPADGTGPWGATADALITDAADGARPLLPAVPVRVLVSPGLPPALGIAEHAVTDTDVLALSGILDLIGHPDQAPVPLGGAQAAGLAGLAAFSGLVAALAAGRPETVRVSALEACLWSNWKSYAERLYMGRTPTRQGALAEWQAIPCVDGFATLVYLEKDWPAVCRMIGDPRLSAPPLDTQAGRRADQARVYEIVRPWYRQRTRAEISAAARREGLPIAAVLTVGEVTADAQFAAQRFWSPPAGTAGTESAKVPTIPTVWNGHRFAPAALSDARPVARGTGLSSGRAGSALPLAGVRVLDLGIITAGASTSALLADLGADVIKVEASAYIDPFRSWDRGLGAPDWWNRSRFFQFTNRNKRGIALDLKHPKGKALFLDLVAKADVVVENFRRGVLERLGLGWDALSAQNPRLILCSITSQGEIGPEAGAASYGSTLEANSGLSDLTRDAGGAPLISGILLNYPDQIVSIYAAGIVTASVLEQRRTGTGARLDISQRELASFLIGDHILDATAGLAPPASVSAAMTRASDGRWTCGAPGRATCPVRNGDDILAALAQGEITMAFAKAPDGSDVKGAPFQLGDRGFDIRCRAPDLGEHNAEVLAELLGLGPADAATLAAEGILGTTPKS